MMSYDYPHPVSRTYQYKKITKPLLERKRRARINRCLDELKDLMVDALETEGENISKLEKADILELTVRHLQRLQASRPSGLSTVAVPGEDSSESRWRSGFGHCAAEACRFLTALPGEAADRLARHLASGLQATRQIEIQVPQRANSPPSSPMTSRSSLVSPTLGSLDKTAKLLVRSVSPAGSSTRGSPPPRQNSSPRVTLHPYRGDKVNVTERPHTPPCQVGKELAPPSLVGKETQISIPRDGCSIDLSPDNRLPTVDRQAKTDPNAQPVADDDEEIDVENVDDGDPMWRPW
ncbi:enhancer of split mbeta protein-like [Neodiprion virginianus]|uniref:enhancer of split mbeta protein-like n=1 Tax=Neodiprion virginianus TaxID=2961670 RepID=UPI001EE738DF|nr:enhancer of split mbeta protein-like [Neodiprion virginianus]